jgi:hypothetical protein
VSTLLFASTSAADPAESFSHPGFCRHDRYDRTEDQRVDRFLRKRIFLTPPLEPAKEKRAGCSCFA